MDMGRQQGGGTDWLDQWALPAKDGSTASPVPQSLPGEPSMSSPADVLCLETWRRRLTKKAPNAGARK